MTPTSWTSQAEPVICSTSHEARKVIKVKETTKNRQIASSTRASGTRSTATTPAGSVSSALALNGSELSLRGIGARPGTLGDKES